MKKGIFIQANKKQLLGAKIAKHAMETRGDAKELGIPVTIMDVEEIPQYMKYAGMTYKRGGEVRSNNSKDLQFFTLSRFAPPELMNYEGRALVIDPDIFALSSIAELFETDLRGNAIAACSKKDAWDSSVMILDCNKLKHWKMEDILEGLKSGSEDYRVWMQLREESVTPLIREWNSLDELSVDTKMLHTTIRLTQPWKTGLPIDFTINKMPKIFGIIPREPVHKFLGKYPTHYKPHPSKEIEYFFFELAHEALNSGAVTETEVQQEIAAGNIRPDFFEKLSK